MKTKLFTIILSMGMVLPMFGQQYAITVFEDCEQNGAIKSSTGGIDHGYTYVDLGLSVYWATMNVGATVEEDKGTFYQWGATSVPSYYKWEYYVHGYYDYNNKSWVRKYCTIESQKYYGLSQIDNKTRLEFSDDVARSLWQGEWRMPTHDEMLELVNNCTWTYTSVNGVYGARVTSNVEGYTENSIFIPLGGYKNTSGSTTSSSLTERGYYWTSDLYTSATSCMDSYCLCFYYSGAEISKGANNTMSRAYGLQIRPVLPKE